jgi:putative glutamine amidotransferase
MLIKPSSHLHRALGVDQVEVDSFHHQAVDELGSGLWATATSPDGVIEALEMKEPWVLGLQCEMHEEWRIDRRFLRPFQHFVEAAARFGGLKRPALAEAR